MRKLRPVFVVIPLWALSALSVLAAESTNWRINNPVSMMDWGCAKAQRSAQRTADSLDEMMEKRAKYDEELNDTGVPEWKKKAILEDRKRNASSVLLPTQFGFKYGRAYAGYDFPHDRIVVGVFVAPRYYQDSPPGKIDAESCIGLVEDFRKWLVSSPRAEHARELAESWFAHDGYKSAAMPPNFAKDLGEHITVVVHLDNYEILDSAVTCEEPLPSGPISVVRKKSE
jgi:hypothetical protein